LTKIGNVIKFAVQIFEKRIGDKIIHVGSVVDTESIRDVNRRAAWEKV